MIAAIQITEAHSPHDMLLSEFDKEPISFGEWLVREIDRWYAKNFRQAWVQEMPGGKIAMFSDDSELRTIEGEDSK